VITVNVVGHRSDPADPAVFDRVFAAFEQLRAALSANDAPAIEGSIAAFDDALDAVLIEQSRMGAAISRLDTLSSQLGLLSVNLTDQQSRIEDADLAEVTMNLSMQQAVYEAALAAAAKVLQPTLLNFLNG
jgi:flagellar hook-associated protein 3 FlgL